MMKLQERIIYKKTCSKALDRVLLCYRLFSQQAFCLVEAGKAQAELPTLMMAAFHLGELAKGLCYCACSLTGTA